MPHTGAPPDRIPTEEKGTMMVNVPHKTPAGGQRQPTSAELAAVPWLIRAETGGQRDNRGLR